MIPWSSLDLKALLLASYSPSFFLSLKIVMLCHCSSTMTKDHFLVICNGTKWLLCANVPWNTHSFLVLLFSGKRWREPKKSVRGLTSRQQGPQAMDRATRKYCHLPSHQALQERGYTKIFQEIQTLQVVQQRRLTPVLHMPLSLTGKEDIQKYFQETQFLQVVQWRHLFPALNMLAN